MSLNYIASIESDSARIVAALKQNRRAPIPWCGDWTVQDCALHVGRIHHGVAAVIDGRPKANFGLLNDLVAPDATDPTLATWSAEGTAALVDRLTRVPGDERCWTWWPEDQSVAFWARRMAHETLVHRWDIETAAGVTVVPADPELAADGIDEFLDIFVGATRFVNASPGSGETMHVHCTNTKGEWLIEFPAAGERTLRREHAKGDVAFRGPAEGLLLFLWGHQPGEEAGVETIGDAALAARWRELAPSM